MKDFKKDINEYYATLIETINNLDTEEINKAINCIEAAYEREANIYVCGNGGSAATASHMQNDFNKGVSEYTEKKFRFVCLNDNVATLMAIANDISYDDVFSFQLKNKIKPTDVLIAISGSGNSKNIIKAVDYAREVGAKIIGISGYDGGKLKQLSDYNVHVDINDMQIAEDVHMTFVHMMMKVFMNTLTVKVSMKYPIKAE